MSDNSLSYIIRYVLTFTHISILEHDGEACEVLSSEVRISPTPP